MENAEKIIEFAPIICVILMFVWQNNVFVRPEQLEKKHREIIKEVENEIKDKYVELNAYKEFQNHVIKEIETIKSDMNKGFEKVDKKIDDKFAEIKELLLKQTKDGI